MYKSGDKELLLCECESPEHLMVVFFEEDENHPIVYFQVHLKKISLLKRIIYGIKYIFGFQSKYGAFDEFILNKKDYIKIENVLKYLNK